jgi:hypothetical protein
LNECLEKLGIHQSRLVPCFLIPADMVYLHYVDSSVLIGLDRTILQAMITNLITEYDLTCEVFLIQISKFPINGSLTFTQEGLARCVLETTGLLHTHSALNSVNKEALGASTNCLLTQEHWDICTVVGMLIYHYSYPGITFTAH